MRDQSESISKTEQKREALIGFTNYTHEEISNMSDEEIRKIYHDLFS